MIFLNYIKKLIEYNSNPSSKRFIGLVAGLSLCAYMFVFPNEAANNSVLILALGALGINAAEKLINIKKK
ncbi:hypothetical protein ACFFLS_06135 [Flavobacterium procerum]|uniref:Uncharacterized protein n=2 Tax=Flavobacterium TaxID=237 RepID=A0A9N8P0B8_9FLAO|nr:hypothetical protein [Flavobacterium panici]CAC9972904.1 hypothetical protein FLAPXU55_00583 [Flavobacterium panici]